MEVGGRGGGGGEEEEGVATCPVCGGRLRSADLLQTHVDFCLARLEKEEESKRQQQAGQQQGATTTSVPTSPRRGGDDEGASSSTGAGGSTSIATSAGDTASSSTTPRSNGNSSASVASKMGGESAAAGGAAGGLRGVLNLFGRGRRANAQQVNVKREYKRLRKDIVESPLCFCTKREAVQLASLAMRLDIAREERRSKKPKEELDFYKKERQKPSLPQYYPAHWRGKSETAELSEELLNELDLLNKTTDGLEPAMVEDRLRGQYVDICQSLPFYGMTVYTVLEWRIKSTDDPSAKGDKGDDVIEEPGQAEDDKINSNAKEETKDTKKAQKKREKLEKKRIKERERLEEKERKASSKPKKSKKVKYEKVPVSLGITRNCSLIKINDRTGEIELAMRITQLKSYSLMLRDSRKSQKRPTPQNLTIDDFILTLDFGEFFPHYLQLINRRAGLGLLGQRGQKLRDGAMLRLSEENEDSIRMIYAHIHSYIQEATGRAREDRKRMEERLQLYGLRERDVVGDGNCQMRAISYQLFNTEDRHSEVRRSIVKWLRNNSSYPVREASSGRVISRLVDFLETDYHRSWGDYCSYMSKDQSWGDHITLLSAAEVYSVDIWILSSVDVSNENGEASEPWTTIEPQLSQAKRMIRLAHWHEKHYSVLSPAS